MAEDELTELTALAAQLGYRVIPDSPDRLLGGLRPYVLHKVGDTAPPDTVSHSAANLTDLRELIEGIRIANEAAGATA